MAKNPNYANISLLYRAVQKYSWDKFKLVLLVYTKTSKEEILSKEQYYLNLYRPYYNILTEAGSP